VKYKLYLIYYNTIKQVHQIVHQINNKHIEFHITISNKFMKINLVPLNVIPLPPLIHDVFFGEHRAHPHHECHGTSQETEKFDYDPSEARQEHPSSHSQLRPDSFLFHPQ
jgi:hypothetical protein